MAFDVEYTDEFGEWWDRLTVAEQEDVGAVVLLLEMRGPQLSFPYTSAIATSRHSHMRELRIQHGGRPYRILYAFDPRRNAILLIGGEKRGTTGGTKSSFRSRMPFTASTCERSERKD